MDPQSQQWPQQPGPHQPMMMPYYPNGMPMPMYPPGPGGHMPDGGYPQYNMAPNGYNGGGPYGPDPSAYGNNNYEDRRRPSGSAGTTTGINNNNNNSNMNNNSTNAAAAAAAAAGRVFNKSEYPPLG
jgi:hypothetical protein